MNNRLYAHLVWYYFRDRLITVVNILGDAVCCSVIDEHCRAGIVEEFHTKELVALNRERMSGEALTAKTPFAGSEATPQKPGKRGSRTSPF